MFVRCIPDQPGDSPSHLTPSTDKVHNFQAVAFRDRRRAPLSSANDFPVALNRDSFSVQAELFYEIAYSGAVGNISLISVNDDCQLDP